MRGYVSEYGACGDCGSTTQKGYVEILEFTHFTEFWTFNEVGVNHKEKVQVRKVEVSVVLDLDTWNTILYIKVNRDHQLWWM